jgi:hypothetical protein
VLPRDAFSGVAVTLTGNYRTARFFFDRNNITRHKAELTDWSSHTGWKLNIRASNPERDNLFIFSPESQDQPFTHTHME